MKAAIPILALLAALITGCDTTPVATTTVDRILKAPTIDNAPYRKVLIVGAMPSRELDRMVEEGLSQELKKRKVEAYSFVRRSPAKRPSEEAVTALVRETGADSVVVVTARFVGAKLQKREGQTEVRADVRGKTLLNYFRYDYKQITQPSYADTTLDVKLVHDVYDTKTQKRVYSLESSTAHAKTTYDIVIAESKAIVARFRKDGLIQ